MDYDNYGTVGKNVKVVEGTASTFTDIAGHWAKDAIEYVTDKALFNGTTATTFSPNEGMTRGMFVTVLGRMAGADISSYNTQSQFADVERIRQLGSSQQDRFRRGRFAFQSECAHHP